MLAMLSVNPIVYYISTDGNRQGWGQMYLYFGCREIDIDNIYSAELKSAMEEGVLKEFYVAQSRNPSMRKVIDSDQQ